MCHLRGLLGSKTLTQHLFAESVEHEAFLGVQSGKTPREMKRNTEK